jgi:hypothetical protein
LRLGRWLEPAASSALFEFACAGAQMIARSPPIAVDSPAAEPFSATGRHRPAPVAAAPANRSIPSALLSGPSGDVAPRSGAIRCACSARQLRDPIDLRCHRLLGCELLFVSSLRAMRSARYERLIGGGDLVEVAPASCRSALARSARMTAVFRAANCS